LKNIERFNELAPESVVVILNDIEENNWDIVSETTEHLPNIHFSKHSFYDECLEDENKVTFGYSNFALQWLSKIPSRFTGKLWKEEMAEHRKLWKEQSVQDLGNFLIYRSKEIIRNGFLLHTRDCW